jgi:hypothetical protein
VEDAAVRPVGGEGKVSASPRRLLVSTVADELKLGSSRPKGAADASRAIGVSLKDRSAILAVGRGADAAYWWDTATGHFITSTYYRPELPAWVRAFNDRRIADTFRIQTWTLLASPSTALMQFGDKKGADFYNAVWGSPFGNDLLLDFAEQVLVNERLGQRGPADVLSVSFSSNDSVGHTHGPDSSHVHDISVRTDRAVGRLLNQVNKTVGLQHTLVVLTADHGVAPLPESLNALRLPGGRMASKDLFGPIQEALEKRFGPGKWILATAGSSPYLNDELMATLRLDEVDVRRVAAEAAAAVPHVARVYTRDQLIRGDVPDDRIGRRVQRGFNAQRSGDLEIVLEPYWIRQAQGTTHGTPYNYDSHIPLILMGRRIAAGQYSAPVAMNDLAPTLATLLGVEIPSGSSGRVLTEALRP